MADIAVVGVELDTSKLEQQARQAEKALGGVEKAADKVGESGKNASKGVGVFNAHLQDMADKLGPVTSRVQRATTAVSSFLGVSNQGLAVIGGVTLGVTALGVAAAITAKQIFDLSVEGAKLADELNDTSRITGLTVGQLSLIKTAAAQGGTSLGEFSGAAAIFASKLEEVSSGKLPKLAGALKAFGIDAKKGMEEPEKAVISFGKALATIEDPVLRAAVAREALGRSGAKLIPLFDALNATTATSGRITDGVARAAGALDDKLAGVSDRAADAKIQLAAITAGGFIEGIDAMSSAFRRMEAALNGIAGSEGLKVIPLLMLFFQQVRPGAVGDALINSASGVTSGGARSLPSRASLLGGGSISRRVRDAIGSEGGGSGGGSGSGSSAAAFSFKDTQGLSAATQFLKDFTEASARFGRQGLDDLSKSITEARFDVTTLSEVLKLLPPTSREAADTSRALAKAQAELAAAEKKRLDLLDATRLPTRLIGQLNTDDVFKGLPGQSTPPGVIPNNLRFEDFFAEFERRRPGELIGLKEQFGGRNDPQTGERIQGAGEQITQDFLTGLLMGQPDVRRAGENIAFFFADYFARKMTENLVKAFDPLFDVIGNAFTSLFSRIFGQIAGGIFGGIGGGGGAVAGSYFLAGGGPISASRGAIVGENGPEFFVPQSNGFIVNQQQAAAAVGGGSIQVTNYFSISAPNGQVDRRSLDQVAESSTFALSRAQRLRGA